MRSALWVLGLLVASTANAVQVQRAVESDGGASRAETPEEIFVRGERLAELRIEVQAARERADAIFNEINSDDDFDVHCRDERRYFSKTNKRVCRAQFEDRISADAAKEYLGSLMANCNGGGGLVIDWQDCMFSPVGQRAADRASAIESQAPGMHDRMNDEILRLARSDLRFGQAILDFYEASQQYSEARERRESQRDR